jgi:hypothetical protein
MEQTEIVFLLIGILLGMQITLLINQNKNK